MSTFYQVHEFAELAGVTVKALHHYDRLGLLKPGRTDAGYRLYTEGDLERLEQIIALKFLGLPLKGIKPVLDRAALELPAALQLQRRVLEQKQQLLARVIRAIQEAEKAIEHGKPAGAGILKKIIEVIDMQESIDEMKRYYSEEAWVKRREHYEQWPTQEWKELYRDVEAVLHEDTAGENARNLAVRWMNLVESEAGGDPEVRYGMSLAWRDRQYWPAMLRERISEHNVERVWQFIGKAIVSYRKSSFDDEAWAKMAGLTHEPDWCELFLEAAAALEEDPACERGHALAARWLALNHDGERSKALIARWKELGRSSTAADDAVQRQTTIFTLERVFGFIAAASYCRFRKYDSLFLDVEAALGDDPSSEWAQSLAARWAELLRADTTSADCPHWPAMLRHHVAFEGVVNFIDAATGA